MRRSIRGFNIPLGNLPPPTPPQKLSLNAPPPQNFLAKDIISNCDFVHIDQALKPRSWNPFYSEPFPHESELFTFKHFLI